MAPVWKVLTAIVLFGCIQGMGGKGTLTIQNIIQGRPELSQLKDFMSSTGIFSALARTTIKFTLFAPNNAAMQALPPAVTTNMDKEKKEQLLHYHVVIATMDMPPWTLNTMKNERVETSASNAPKIFFRDFGMGQQKMHYVNGARVVTGDIVAQNGVVHIVDAVLFPIAQKNNALALIKNSIQNSNLDQRAKIFADLLGKVPYLPNSPHGSLNSDSKFVTIFVPSDKSLEKVLTVKRKEELSQDLPAIIKLLNRHIIVHDMSSGASNEGVTAVWHSALLNRAIDMSITSGRQHSIPAREGAIKPVRIGNTLFVTNMCGMVKVADLPQPMPADGTAGTGGSYQSMEPHYESQYPVMPDQTVNNGVVHFVDGLLGYIYNDAIDMLDEDVDISKFKDYVRMTSSVVDRLTVSGANIIQESNKLTIFAPINGAFVNLERAGNIDLTQNATLRKMMLDMHMVREVLNLVDLTNGTTKKTLRADKEVSAQFYTDRLGTYVEVDRVRARIVKADVCVKNGIIHYIDNLLGMPYRNLLDEIQEMVVLSDLYEAILQTPQFVEGNRRDLKTLKQILKGTTETRTVFAPDTDAFRKLRTTRIGREYMAASSQSELYYLLMRHMAAGNFFIEDNIRGKQEVPGSQGRLSVFKENGRYMVEYSGEHGGAQAEITQRNVRLINGVMHVIDAVLFEDNQLAFNSINGASLVLPSTTLLAFILLNWVL